MKIMPQRTEEAIARIQKAVHGDRKYRRIIQSHRREFPELWAGIDQLLSSEEEKKYPLVTEFSVEIRQECLP